MENKVAGCFVVEEFICGNSLDLSESHTAWKTVGRGDPATLQRSVGANDAYLFQSQLLLERTKISEGSSYGLSARLAASR